MGDRKQMSMSWLNVDWFKRKALHEYQNGGEESANTYLKQTAPALTDSDYLILKDYIKDLTPNDTKEKSEDDKLWRI